MSTELGAGLAGETVLCVGGSGEIGAPVCRAFAEVGARVAVADVDLAAAREVVANLPGTGHRAFAVNLADPTAADRLTGLVSEHAAVPKAVVDLAAVMRRERIEQTSPDSWDLQHQVNARGAFFLARGAAEAMRAQGVAGRIVLYTSQGWWSGGYGDSVVYAASKGAVSTMVRGLARTYGPHGITVNAVSPGAVDSPMLRAGTTESVLENTVRATPLGRFAQPAELAGPTVFLASDHAAFITGTILNVSGGWLAY